MANKQKSYIDKMINLFGENWIVATTSESIQRQGRRIARDMAKGAIDYEKHGKYFLDGKFLENLIISFSNEYEVALLHYNALTFYHNAYPDVPNVTSLIYHDQVECYIFSLLIQKLNMVKCTGNVGELYDIGGILSQYRNHL